MDRIDLFWQLLNQIDAQSKDKPEDFRYLGTGNPNAKILIVGKETSIPSEPNEQQTREISNNFSDWKRIISNGEYQTEKWNGSNYSPLYPYKGQQLKIHSSRTGDNGGTSKTWFNYQKLYNRVYNMIDNQNIDFHEGVFITEANSSSSPKTKDADTSSIDFRKSSILKSNFFQSFPVVIISGVGYFEIIDSNNEIESIFGVKFIRKERALNNESQAYWIHEGTKMPKLLINTRQLSIGVSDALIQDIANEIRNRGLL